MTDETNDLSPIAKAYAWVAKVTTVVAEMVLFGVGGNWLDQQWGTSFLTPLGLMIGVSIGLFHLIWMTKSTNSKLSDQTSHKDSKGEGGSNR